MKPIEKLREILCTVPEIKEDLEKLIVWWKIKEGCVIERWENQTHYLWTDFFNKWEKESSWEVFHYFWVLWRWWGIWRDNIDWVVWENPIQERHLRMYCEKWINKKMIINYFSQICTFDENGKQVKICRINNKKDLQDQEDSVIQSIVDFLESNK